MFHNKQDYMVFSYNENKMYFSVWTVRDLNPRPLAYEATAANLLS